MGRCQLNRVAQRHHSGSSARSLGSPLTCAGAQCCSFIATLSGDVVSIWSICIELNSQYKLLSLLQR